MKTCLKTYNRSLPVRLKKKIICNNMKLIKKIIQYSSFLITDMVKDNIPRITKEHCVFCVKNSPG